MLCRATRAVESSVKFGVSRAKGALGQISRSAVKKPVFLDKSRRARMPQAGSERSGLPIKIKLHDLESSWNLARRAEEKLKVRNLLYVGVGLVLAYAFLETIISDKKTRGSDPKVLDSEDDLKSFFHTKLPPAVSPIYEDSVHVSEKSNVRDNKSGSLARACLAGDGSMGAESVLEFQNGGTFTPRPSVEIAMASPNVLWALCAVISDSPVPDDTLGKPYARGNGPGQLESMMFQESFKDHLKGRREMSTLSQVVYRVCHTLSTGFASTISHYTSVTSSASIAASFSTRVLMGKRMFTVGAVPDSEMLPSISPFEQESLIQPGASVHCLEVDEDHLMLAQNFFMTRKTIRLSDFAALAILLWSSDDKLYLAADACLKTKISSEIKSILHELAEAFNKQHPNPHVVNRLLNKFEEKVLETHASVMPTFYVQLLESLKYGRSILAESSADDSTKGFCIVEGRSNDCYDSSIPILMPLKNEADSKSEERG